MSPTVKAMARGEVTKPIELWDNDLTGLSYDACIRIMAERTRRLEEALRLLGCDQALDLPSAIVIP